MHDSLIAIIWAIIGFVDPVIVYLDATNHGIGKIKGNRSFLNLSAVEWGSATAILGLPSLILYLCVREKKTCDFSSRNSERASSARRLNVVLILVSIRFWMICLLANYRAVLSIP